MKKPDNRKGPPALVLGSGVTALGALRALSEYGVECYVAGAGGALVSDSRWFRQAPGSDSYQDLSATPASVQSIGLDHGVLIPCSDSSTLAVAQLAESGETRFLSSTCSSEVLQLFQDKQRFAGLLTDLSVPHPLTMVVNDARDLEVLDRDNFSHAFLKPADSQTFMAHYGVKAFWVGSKDDAVEKWQAAQEHGFDMVLQEYVAGAASDHYYIDGFVDRHGRICGQLARRRLRIYPADFGNSTLMVSVPLAEVAQASDSLAKIFAATKVRGIFSAEFKLDAHTGDLRLLEINARAWWYVDFARRCGVDVCAMTYEDALDRKVTQVDNYAIGKRCVYPYYDIAALREARAQGSVALGKWFAPWLGAYQPVWRMSDPKPAIKATASILKNSLRARRSS